MEMGFCVRGDRTWNDGEKVEIVWLDRYVLIFIGIVPVSQKESNSTMLSLIGGINDALDQYRLPSVWKQTESIFSRTDVYTESVSVVKMSSALPSRMFFEHPEGRRPARALE
jgi:hypothetical protein